MSHVLSPRIPGFVKTLSWQRGSQHRTGFFPGGSYLLTWQFEEGHDLLVPTEACHFIRAP
ncbi:hypothetical protein COLO4_14895 [Corchorus olitorius]|uniref:Uncharacterized protein n=1 Tax=Corchorus olitorius TaxID=93759 RepID=A0A1R3JQQ8_9ROSI|nr:hypothetical protein COLO4_14895 [Corchorus olitorius]